MRPSPTPPTSRAHEQRPHLAPPLPPNASVPLSTFLVAGAIGGVASRTFTAPLEKIKIDCQAKNMTPSAAITRVVRLQGISGFFAGNMANCLRVAPYAGSVCVAYKICLGILPDSMADASKRLAAGGVAGTFGTLLTYPFDIIRARITVSDAPAGIAQTAKSIVRDGGIRNLYRGLGTTLFTVGPFVGIQQMTYDVSKRYAMEALQSPPSPQLFLGCGALAAMSAQSVVYPLDMLRRRIQVSAAPSSITGIGIELSTWLALRRAIKRGGVGALYAGMLPSLVKTIPAVAVSVICRDAALGRFG